MIFVDGSERPVEQHGDVFIERWTEASDDSIYAGVELTMNYSTYLLNGASLLSAFYHDLSVWASRSTCSGIIIWNFFFEEG